MINYENVIYHMLLNKSSNIYYLNEQGVEIGEDLIKLLGWNKLKSIRIGIGNGELILSNILKFDNRLLINNGKIKIPKNMFKKAGLDSISAFTAISDCKSIILRAYNLHLNYYINAFINSLDNVQVENLANIILGRKTEIEPFLFLLNKKDFVFRPVNFPFRIHGTIFDNTFFLYNCSNSFYLLPGINRITKNIGFLLLDDILYSKILKAFNNCNINDCFIEKDLIFIYSPFCNSSVFKVFSKPKEEIYYKTIERAQLVCNNPEKFVEKTFHKIDICDKQYSDSLYETSIKNFKNKPKLEGDYDSGE